VKKESQKDLSRHEIELNILDVFQRSIALIGVYDHNEVLRYTNEAFRSAYFVDPEEQIDWQTLMRRNFAASRGTVIKTDDIESWISSVRSRRGKSRQRTYESDLHGERFIWVTETMRDDGWIIYVGTDVTSLNVSERKLRLANEDLFRQSFTDELTGVSNRRHILGKLQETLDAGQDGWACLLDIDHFKKINDTYGHQVGDDVLTSIAQTTRKAIRLKDSFGRVGGEEFLILFASQSLDDVASALRHLHEAICGLEPVKAHPGLKVTVSGGLTCISPGNTQSQILRRADVGLYFAKANGRAQIRFVKAEDDADHSEIIGSRAA
jgi:diguanylate cyclase (GGDEF)-like protein